MKKKIDSDMGDIDLELNLTVQYILHVDSRLCRLSVDSVDSVEYDFTRALTQ